MKKFFVLFISFVLLNSLYGLEFYQREPVPIISVKYNEKLDLSEKDIWLIHKEVSTDSIKEFKSPEYNDTSWERYSVPKNIKLIPKYKNYDGVFWYRLHLYFPKDMPEKAIGIRLGIILDAEQVFINGIKIGEAGSIEKNEHAYDIKRYYEIPLTAIRYGQDNVIAIRCNNFLTDLGITRDVVYIETLHNVINSVLNEEYVKAIFVVFYLVAAIYFLLFFIRRPSSRDYLFFGLFVLVMSMYFFMRCNLKYLISNNFLLLKKIEYIVLYFIFPFFMEFITQFYKKKHNIVHYIFFLVSLIGIIFVFFTSSPVSWNMINTKLIQYSWLIAIGYILYVLFNESFKKNLSAIFMLFSFLILVGGTFNDVLIERGLYYFIKLTPFAFLFFISSMALILANRFVYLHNIVEDLNINLENKVRERTGELNKTLQILKEKDARFQKELKMAGMIQRGLLPKKIEPWNEIRITDKYMPLKEVGGDYYDVLSLPDDHIGIMIADVSGHGVPAALITTMAKRAFTKAALKYYSPIDIFKEVNTELCDMIVTQEYLTCFFISINKEYDALCSNAAHQKAIHLSIRNKFIAPVNTSGMFIGAVREANNTYSSVKIHLEKGDKILLFTDCLIESTNVSQEPYSMKQLLTSLKKNIRLTGEDFLQAVLNDFFNFIGENERKDDLSTVLIERI